jgi:hypothetical protein
VSPAIADGVDEYRDDEEMRGFPIVPPSFFGYVSCLRDRHGGARSRVILELRRATAQRDSRGRETSFFDGDPADLHAYHIVARLRGRAIGCSRIVPLANGRRAAVLG